MNNPKYSLLENERRFLIKSLPEGFLDSIPFKEIEDKYFDFGRLRLRKMKDSETTEPIYKLCKKYESVNSASTPIVNTYLNSSEYEGLNQLPGNKIFKRRYIYQSGEDRFGLDIFQGELEGLILCEIEKESLDSLLSVEIPHFAAIEVTKDEFFQGGNLCKILHKDLREKINLLASA